VSLRQGFKSAALLVGGSALEFAGTMIMAAPPIAAGFASEAVVERFCPAGGIAMIGAFFACAAAAAVPSLVVGRKAFLTGARMFHKHHEMNNS
jgi:hypothetical protein